jgi:hypothetical protein
VTQDKRAGADCAGAKHGIGLSRAILAVGTLAMALCGSTALVVAQPKPEELAAQEKEACTRNLKIIYQAIQAYELDHKDLPNWLSDLVPKYLPDANVLVCPVCRRTGKTEDPALADPKLSSSYLFEFCPVYVDTGDANGPMHTRREWKRRQMGLVGSMVPVVRCRQHDPVLNLAFDGHIYESPGSWERLFTNRLDIVELTAPRLFAGDAPPKPAPPSRFPARDAKAGPGLLDLTRYYNVSLSEAWLGKDSATLAPLPEGLQTFAKVEFDVRGILQAGSQVLADKKYPRQIKGIAVHRKCKHLHFLHAACHASAADAGVQIASYFVHYAGNPARLEIPVVCGHDVRDWIALPEEPAAPSELTIAWTGHNFAKSPAETLRLFKTTWTNLVSDAEIESLDFVSSMAGPAPFLVAITAD